MSVKALKNDTRPLNLILAATVPSLGIGLNGTLPWHLPKELKYFRQVTTTHPKSASDKKKTNEDGIVIMGRRTWESIPTKFRPLANRINIVLSSKLSKENEKAEEEKIENEGSTKKQAPVYFCDSLNSALDLINEKWPESPGSSESPNPKRIFIIGGAQLYRAALQHPRSKHIYLTEVESTDGNQKEIECDTFLSEFPWYKEVGEKEDEGKGKKEWIRQNYKALKESLHSSVELPQSVDEAIKQMEWIEEKGYKYRFTLWSRE